MVESYKSISTALVLNIFLLIFLSRRLYFLKTLGKIEKHEGTQDTHGLKVKM